MSTAWRSSFVLVLPLLFASGSGAVVWPGNDHQYRLVFVPEIPWADADAAADALGGGWHLATITSAEEDAFVASLVQRAGGIFWLGGFQDPLTTLDPAANWTWVTGEPWQYTNWLAPEEPNDAFGPGSEQYVTMQTFDLGWNDEGNLNQIWGYVLETPVPIPEPATLVLLAAGLLGLTARPAALRAH